jgi:hypothetical protein
MYQKDASMSKERITGFMLGLSAGFVVSYFLRPSEHGSVPEQRGHHDRDANVAFNERSTGLPRYSGTRANRQGPVPVDLGGYDRQG